jgi:hypothetical protein
MLTPLFNNLIHGKTRPLNLSESPGRFLEARSFQELRKAAGFAQRGAHSWTNCDSRCIGRRIRCRTTLE